MYSRWSYTPTLDISASVTVWTVYIRLEIDGLAKFVTHYVRRDGLSVITYVHINKNIAFRKVVGISPYSATGQ